ncbi:MAG: isoprenyl transferase [Lachnospiraceae bacterium]|nr:isoprenyl transferase [Lachnospiraceae bacterium]
MSDDKLRDGLVVPKHVAIILDGNGRWAKKRLMPRSMGHVQGAKNVEKTCRVAHKLGIKHLTVYAFSTENWKRDKKEIDALMKLLGAYLDDCIRDNEENNMIVKFIGDMTPFSDELKEKIDKLTLISKDNTGLNLNIAINYGGRDEIVRAMKKITMDVQEDKLSIDDINEQLVSNYLDTKDIPDPDLLVRTSGEQRLSNYLLWQLAYAEFYFTSVHWPDFDEDELIKAIEYYNTRERRFGGVK